MIYEHLSEGEQNAKSGKFLQELLNLNAREISQAVERERRAGKPICASCNGSRPGYYIPATREEMERYIKRLHHRAGKIFKTRAACLKALEQLPAGGAENGKTE